MNKVAVNNNNIAATTLLLLICNVASDFSNLSFI